jgi:hypothetical protein
MINKFPVKLGKKDIAKTPAANSPFNLGTCTKLDTKGSEIFHTFVAKGFYSFVRGQGPIFSKQSWYYMYKSQGSKPSGLGEDVIRVMIYLNGTRSEYLALSANDLRVVKWYVDASFMVHPDFKSHTGAVMMLGKGAMQSIARKQKMNVQSSTEGKEVTVDNASTMILWTKLFLEAQGYDVKKNIVYKDN